MTAPRLSANALPIALAIVCGVYGWARFVAVVLGFDGTIGPYSNAPGCDWAMFYTAGRGVLVHLPIYDQAWLKQTLNADLAWWLFSPVPHPAFHYPPVYLLVVVPFSLLPFAPSYWAFQAASFGVLLVAVARYADNWRQFVLYAAVLALCPAASNGVLAGQNVFLVAALYVFAAGWLRTHPRLSGTAFALLCIKPQLALMVPFALIGGRCWRVLRWGIVVAVGVCVASALLFGWQLWAQWAHLVTHAPPSGEIGGIAWGRMWDDSVYSVVRRLGAGVSLANIVQAVAAVGAGACVWHAFRNPYADDLRFGVLLTAAMLAAPHLSGYDMLLSTLAVLILVRRNLAIAMPIAPWMLWVWCLPFFGPPKVSVSGLLVPPILLACIVALLRTNRDKTKG